MITRTSMHIFGGASSTDAPRRGGRPKVIEPRIPITARITPREYDAIARAASQRGVTISAFVRASLRASMKPGAVRRE